jgi:lysozyme
MRYTSDRIYGIDISRYQHEQGRKRFNINWKQMNITSLGAKGSQQEETSTYPVSFVYIKATEGISISNRYFLSDYSAARRQNLRVGAYHFFSTKQSGSMQANYFLSKAILQRGDLPPVLDIEPSDKMIERMGGSKRLFDEIRAWIRIVERHTGTKPLLYVNQRFVKKYLDEAPDLKSSYSVWIARYGEYKPDVHLAIWQLSPNGRVSGIHGPVDINVFNGYEGQWQELLEQETVKR